MHVQHVFQLQYPRSISLKLNDERRAAVHCVGLVPTAPRVHLVHDYRPLATVPQPSQIQILFIIFRRFERAHGARSRCRRVAATAASAVAVAPRPSFSVRVHHSTT